MRNVSLSSVGVFINSINVWVRAHISSELRRKEKVSGGVRTKSRYTVQLHLGQLLA